MKKCNCGLILSIKHKLEPLFRQIAALLENQGVAWLPTYLIGGHIQKEELIPLLLDGNVTYETHALYALYFPSKYSNPKIRSFIDFLISELQPVPAWDSWIPQYKKTSQLS